MKRKSLNNIYVDLVKKVLNEGYEYEDPNRKGVIRKQIDSYSFSIPMKKGRIEMLTCKKTFPRMALHEMYMFLSGTTDIRVFREFGIKFWDDDFNRFRNNQLRSGNIPDPNNLVGTYPTFIRNWKNQDLNKVDQLREVIKTLKKNPTSTKKTITMWNPLTISTLTPCHHMIQFMYNPENNELSLKWSQHSCDLFLGIPMNILYYSFMLHFVSSYLKMNLGSLYADLTNIHLYDNSIEHAKKLKRDNKFYGKNLYIDTSNINMPTIFNLILGRYINAIPKNTSLIQKSNIVLFGRETNITTSVLKPERMNVKMLTYNK